MNERKEARTIQVRVSPEEKAALVRRVPSRKRSEFIRAVVQKDLENDRPMALRGERRVGKTSSIYWYASPEMDDRMRERYGSLTCLFVRQLLRQELGVEAVG